MKCVFLHIVSIFVLSTFSLGNIALAGKEQGTAKSDTILLCRTGTASYYAPKFQGRHTSNGEKLDNDAYTCASSRLPYDTWVRVTNLRNGKWVVVRVTDRFAPGGSHLVDLTLRAATDIDIVSRGIAKVRMEVLNPDFVRCFLPKDTISVPLEMPEKSLLIPVQVADRKPVVNIP